MCDYSLQHLASRPAKVGDKLITTKFTHSLTGGFCAPGCLPWAGWSQAPAMAVTC